MKNCLPVLILALFAIIFSSCSSQPVIVEGAAMMPNFSNGDKILIDRNWKELNRGDVIAFLYPKDRTKWYIKRIIAVSGETIEIREGKVYINGEIFNEPYIDESYNQAKANFPPRRVPEYQYFVMGDNRGNSSDSRHWGTVDKELIKGKYYMTYSEAKK